LEAQNAEFSMNDIVYESAIAAPLHLVPSREESAHTFKDVLVDAAVCLAPRSAPPGPGKTSFSCAFMVAVTRYAEKYPEAPHGCVFVTDRIQRADQVYRDLEAAPDGGPSHQGRVKTNGPFC
jgi:hypothetical protein